tara:strand:- start:1385 stop:2923 length:1539 start_codon:yes stop_codon:yes gene_type:complete
MKDFDKILVLDYGSQYTQLIARRIRDLNVFSEICPHDISIDRIKEINPNAIILSGGPMSVYSDTAYKLDLKIIDLGLPVLGICYGMQLLMKSFEAEVVSSDVREYGHMKIDVLDDSNLFQGIDSNTSVWMSHGDKIGSYDSQWISLANSKNGILAAVKHKTQNIYGVQFHPEVNHTDKGEKILANFLYNIANCRPLWTSENFIDNTIQSIKDEVGNKNVICGISGGVDSSVMGALINKAIGEQGKFIFVNHGLLRKGEEEDVMESLHKGLGMNIECVNARDVFLKELAGCQDPEQKRKIIGRLFIETFEEASKKFENIDFLAQGTLYPDVIESGGSDSSVTIKSHHNVGGLPEKMNFKLIEPLRDLFKDEVREVGRKLGVPDFLVDRHPFPGPGLAVRVIGEITEERLRVLKEADDIYIKTLVKMKEYNNIWQAFAVLVPIKTVGVMGDGRTYENLVALRAVTSKDGMTADWYRMPDEVLQKISSEIVNNVKGVNRVVYDVTSKPPGTIEWE